MPRPPLRDAQESFSGGLNLAADESRLAPNELRRADNARLTEFGGITHRGGTQRVSEFPLPGYADTISGTNLIDNPSMDVDDGGWASYLAAAVIRDTGTPYPGSSASALVALQAFLNSGVAIFADDTTNRWAVTPGQTYRNSISVYGTGSAIGTTFRLYTLYYDSPGVGAGVALHTDYSEDVVLAAGWNEITYTATVPEGAASAHFRCSTNDLVIWNVWMGGASSVLIPEAPVKGGHFWLRPESTNQVLAVCNGSLYTGTYGVPMTWTQQSGALDAAVQPSMVTFRDESAGEDVVYIADGGGLNKWNGTTLSTDLTDTPNVSILAVYNNRLYGCGDPDNPYRLYWSDLQDGDTLGIIASGGGYADIRTFAQSELTGLQPLGAGLLIFHRNGISRFTGISIDDIDIAAGTRGVSSDVGTFSPHAIIAVENVCLFLSDRGIFQVTEDGLTAVAERPGGGVNSIGDRIESVLRGVNQSTLSRAVVGHNRAYHEVLFYLPDVGVYAFNYRLGAWSGPWTGAYRDTPTHSMWSVMDTTDAPVVLFGSSDGRVRLTDAPGLFEDDYLADGSAGTPNAMVFQCRRMDCRTPTAEKAYRWIFLTFNPRGTVTGGISWVTQDSAGSQSIMVSNTTAVWDDGSLWDDPLLTWSNTGGGTSIPARVQAHGSGNYIDITIVDDSATGALYSRVEVHGFLMGERY